MASGLASLSANYTDSEGEEIDQDEDSNSRVEIPFNYKNTLSSSGTSTPAIGTPVSSGIRLTGLVPYQEAGGDHNAGEISEGEELLEENKEIIHVNRDSDWENCEELEEEEEENEDLSKYNLLSGTDLTVLPPEPTGSCSRALQEKFNSLFEKKVRNNLDMNEVIQKKKDFRNPSIYEKLIQFCGIDELGTNFPPEIFDPHRWGPESYYDQLAKVQREELDKREKERKERTKFVSGTAKKSVPEETTKRKSKWDQVSGVKPIKPASAFGISAGAAKAATVISAFGMIPKRPK